MQSIGTKSLNRYWSNCKSSLRRPSGHYLISLFEESPDRKVCIEVYRELKFRRQASRIKTAELVKEATERKRQFAIQINGKKVGVAFLYPDVSRYEVNAKDNELTKEEKGKQLNNALKSHARKHIGKNIFIRYATFESVEREKHLNERGKLVAKNLSMEYRHKIKEFARKHGAFAAANPIYLMSMQIEKQARLSACGPCWTRTGNYIANFTLGMFRDRISVKIIYTNKNAVLKFKKGDDYTFSGSIDSVHFSENHVSLLRLR